MSKQRRSDTQIVSHQIGDATCQHELAIENYLPNRIYKLVCFFSKNYLPIGHTTDYRTIEISDAWKRFTTFLVVNLFQASEIFLKRLCSVPAWSETRGGERLTPPQPHALLLSLQGKWLFLSLVVAVAVAAEAVVMVAPERAREEQQRAAARDGIVPEVAPRGPIRQQRTRFRSVHGRR